MYKVYLVDDDRLILDELADAIPWMDNGFFVAGSSTDPVKAVCEIKEIKPDVVFCDIKMPEMDGNQLNKALKEDGCKAKVVMLSAYDDFVHVREFGAVYAQRGGRKTLRNNEYRRSLSHFRFGEEGVDWDYSDGSDVSIYGTASTIVTHNYIWNTFQNKHFNGIGPMNVPLKYLQGITWNGVNSDTEYIDGRASLFKCRA